MLDFHAHVLPGADHGSDGLNTSLRQLALAEQAGIDVLIATPHFYPQADDFGHFLRKRKAALRELTENYRGPIRLLAGAEVHMCVGLDHLDGLEELCIPGTNVMLCELPFRGVITGLTDTFERLLDDRGICPVLAHVDRYDPVVINNLFGMGLLGQLNAEPFTHRFRRRRLLPWIDRGHIVALGSDIHGTEIGYSQYIKARDFLGGRFDTIEARARELLKDVL
jgi:protein-tyrosine phosphatase